MHVLQITDIKLTCNGSVIHFYSNSIGWTARVFTSSEHDFGFRLSGCDASYIIKITIELCKATELPERVSTVTSSIEELNVVTSACWTSIDTIW